MMPRIMSPEAAQRCTAGQAGDEGEAIAQPPPPTTTGLLDDIRVIDLAGESGLFAGRLLASLGADVVHVEPLRGAPERWRRPFLDDTEGVERSLYHLHFNAGKRGITLDLESDRGRDVLCRLAACSDVLIETAAPGEMDSIGIGYEQLREGNPGLLYGTITPFGQEGPMARYRANDLVASAMSGLMFLNGLPEDPPNQPTAEQAYHMSSLALASGILIGLVGRDLRSDAAGSRGVRIDVSMQEAATMATFQTANPNSYTWHGDIPGRRGFLGPSGSRSLFQCRDGLWVSFVVPPPRWDDFLRWLDEEAIESEVSDDQHRDRAFRTQNPAATVAAIQQLVERYDRADLFHEGQGRRLLVMPVNDAGDLAGDAQLNDRGFFAETEHPALGVTLRDVSSPFVFNGQRPQFDRPAPALGESNEDVYRGLLGMSAAELTSLREEGVV